MDGDYQRNHVDQAIYHAFGSSRDSYRYNHLYPAFIAPKYCHCNNNGVDKGQYQHQEPARKVLDSFSTFVFFVYRIIMWLARKLLRVRGKVVPRLVVYNIHLYDA